MYRNSRENMHKTFSQDITSNTFISFMYSLVNYLFKVERNAE